MPKFLDLTSPTAARTALGVDYAGAVTAVKTTGYTAAVGEIVRCDAVSGGFTVTLPAAPANGSKVTVKKVDTSSNTVLVQRSGSDVFNVTGGASSVQLAVPSQTVTLRYESGIWHVLGNSYGPSALMNLYAPKRMMELTDLLGNTVAGLVADDNIDADNHNYVTVANSFNNSSGANPIIGVDGTAAACSLTIQCKGASRVVEIRGDSGAKVAEFLPFSSSAVDYLRFASATGAAMVYGEGASASVPIYLRPKSNAGTPAIYLGTSGNTAVSVNAVSGASLDLTSNVAVKANGNPVEVTSNKDTANGYAGLNASSQLTKDTTGNAATATKLVTARTIAGVSFDGTANIEPVTAATVGPMWFPSPTYTSGNYYFTNQAHSSTVSQPSNGTLRVSPWVVVKSVTISALFAEVTTAGADAGAVIRLGIWADTGSFKPGTLVLDAGTIAAGSAVTPGVFEITGLSTTLAPGVYWVGGAPQGVTGTAPIFRFNTLADITWPAHLFPLGTSLPGINTTAGTWQQNSMTGSFGTVGVTTFTGSPSAAAAGGLRVGFKVA